MQGGDTPNVNMHVSEPSQAYGIDFAVVGGGTGRDLARGKGLRAEDFYCWDSPVVSPVFGIVIAALDSLPDNALGQRDSLRVLGNHVILREGDRYFYLAHLRRGSLAVHAGDSVKAGAALGRCGNSGNSDFPHIHLHATHSPDFGGGLGINLVFSLGKVRLSDKTFTNVEWPLIRGLWVWAGAER